MIPAAAGQFITQKTPPNLGAGGIPYP